MAVKKIHHRHFFIGGLVAFFITGIFLGGLIIVTMRRNGSFSTKLHAFKPGLIVANDFFDVRVDTVSSSSGTPGSLTPHVGMKFIIVDLYVKNKTSKVAEIFPATQTYIKDDQGHVYGLGAVDLDKTFYGGDLSPGDRLKGKIAYEVPVDIKQPQFYIEGLSSTPVVIKLD